MANQSVGTPRFFIDFTQLAKAKGFSYPQIDADTSENIIGGGDPRNVWDFDYSKTTSYTAESSQSASYDFKMAPFWTMDPDELPQGVSTSWAGLMGSANFVGLINHNIITSYNGVTAEGNLKIRPYFKGFDDGDLSQEHQNFATMIDSIVNAPSHTEGECSTYFDGYCFAEMEFDALQYGAATSPSVYSQFGLRLETFGDTYDSDFSFDLGAITFGRYIDMPNAPDLNVKKSVEYDGTSIKRTLGGSDYVQVNHQGCPDWVTGEPWVSYEYDDLHNYQKEYENYPGLGRFGRNGRRSWDLSFSYIGTYDMFYDLSERAVGLQKGTQNHNGIAISWQNTRDHMQLVWDLTLGGALSFVFCPDKDANKATNNTEPEFAVCRLDQDSLVATQVAHNTWNVSMRVVEVW